ncbi:hypothetical protein SAMN05661080_03287 [Modestobacter sp. DSM 44400]|uniref:hypothetical protein n=1 Tax=Modestobacter sp. DSM 44400 TaxID=1550230 RepID=UPI000894D54D|nr:hypothetical protein [Modestobacter sp. DSM 44400]SDY38171.1 hypothetical protein SAMN05661080_03287 [Modestobacter sp. DSM 44400]
MPNVVGFQVRRDVAADEDAAPTPPGKGPLHAVAGAAGRTAQESSAPVQALCGEWVRVVGAEQVPDDAGLCPACQYGA